MMKKIFFCLVALFMLLTTGMKAQTVPATLPYTCDFEDAVENANWTIVNGTAANKWVIDTAINHTDGGAQSLYISNDNGVTNAYTATSASIVWAYRDIDLGEGIYNAFRLKFNWKNIGEGTYDYINVYVGDTTSAALPTTDVVTPQGATLICEILSQQQDWQTVYQFFNTTFHGVKRIYFMWRNDGSVGNNPPAAIDDIEVIGYECGYPYQRFTESILPTEATFHFTPASPNDNAWEYVVQLNDGSPLADDYVATPINDTTFTITNLLPATSYKVWLRTTCGSENSIWLTFNFTTACSFVTIPYEQYFDNTTTGAGKRPLCWQNLTNSSTSYPYVTTNNTAPTAGNVLYFNGTDAYYQAGIAPEIDTTINPINTLTLSFKVKKSAATYGNFKVGVMTDPTDLSTFTAVQAITSSQLDNTTDWFSFEIPFTDYTGYGSFITILKDTITGSTTSNIFYIDNFRIFTTPSCSNASNVSLSNITHNSVTVNWEANEDESAWEVAVVEHGSNVENATPETTYEYPYTFMGLTDNTKYDVYVRTLCSDGTTAMWTEVKTFTTTCLPVSELPYTENFSGFSGTGATQFPSCMLRKTNYTVNYPYVNYNTSLGDTALYFYNTTSYYCLATTPAIDFSNYVGQTINFSFKIAKTSASYGRIKVGTMTDPQDPTTFSLLKNFLPEDYLSTNTFYEQNLAYEVTSADAPVYFAFFADQGTLSYTYIDDIVVDVATRCFAPAQLQIEEVGITTVSFNWINSSFANDCLIEYCEAGTNNWTVVENAFAGNNYTLMGLQAQTDYEVRISSNCNITSDSTEYATIQFTTNCIRTDLTLGTGTTGTYYLPTVNYYKYSYTQQLFKAEELAGLDTIAVIAFDYKHTSPMTKKTNVKLYLMPTTLTSLSSAFAPFDSTTAVLVYDGSLNMSATGWNQFTLSTPFAYDGTSNLVLIALDNSGQYDGSSYTFNATTYTAGISRYYNVDGTTPISINSDGTIYTSGSALSGTVANYRTNTQFLSTCMDESACLMPSVNIPTATSESITLSWLPGYTESEWEIEYKPSNESIWNNEGTVSDLTYTIHNLSVSTSYNIRIRSVCNDGNYSEWTTLTAQTECLPITSLPFSENFDNATGSGAAHFISCWSKGTNYATSYPYSSSAQSLSAPYSIYFYGGSDAYSYMATPRFDENIAMDSLYLEFYLYYSSIYDIQVGIMTNPNDYSTFEFIQSVRPDSVSKWRRISLDTRNYTGNGRYIAFRAPSGTTSYMYMDNLYVDYIPACDAVTNLHTTTIAENEATITWTDNESTEWEIFIGLATEQLNIDNVEISYSNSFTFTDLLPNTKYTAWVRPMCTEGGAMWRDVTFKTECSALTEFPYSENFDTYSTGSSAPFVDCWKRLQNYNTSSNYPYVNTTFNNSAPNSLYFYTSSTTYNMAILPKIDESIDLSTLRLTFMGRASNANITSSNAFQIGTLSNPLDAANFEVIDTIAWTATSAWEEKIVDFTQYQGSGRYIALRLKNPSAAGNVYIDDVVLDYIPSCNAVENLTATNISSTEATLQWSAAGEETSWEVVVSTNTLDESLAVQVSDTSYIATGLSASTDYICYVRPICSDGYSPWNSINFSTAQIPAQLPYAHNFENEEENGNWTLVNGTINKWHIGNATHHGEGNTALYISNDNGITNNYTINVAGICWAYRDFEVTANTTNVLSFDWRAQGESSFDYITVFAGPVNPVSAQTSGTFPTLDGTVRLVERLNQNAEYTHATLILPTDSVDGVRRIYFAWRQDASGGTSPAGAIDNITIEETCLPATNLTSSNLLPNSFDLTWNSNNADQWEVAIAESNQTLDASTAVNVTTNNYSFTGLTSGTHYTVYVRTICPDTTYDWTTAEIFTPCDLFSTLPFIENFDTYTTGSSAPFVDCWYRLQNYSTSINYPYVNGSYATTGSNGLYFYAGQTSYSMAILPGIDPILNLSSLRLTFDARAGNATVSGSTGLQVGVLTNPTDESTFELVQTISWNNHSQWEEKIVDFANYTGQGNYIAIRLANVSGYVYVDKIHVDVSPTCDRPVITSVTTTLNDATVTVTPSTIGTPIGYEYVYGAIGFDPSTGTPVSETSETFTIPGLNSSSMYDLYVRSLCSATDISEWSLAYRFTTPCDLVNVPYSENFDSYIGTAYNVAGDIALCWDNFTNNTTYPAPHIVGSGSYWYPHSTPNVLTFTAGSAGNDAIAILPEFTAPINQLNLSFFYKMENVTYGQLTVGYVTDVDNPVTSFTTVATIPNTTTITADTVSFNTLTNVPTGARIAFHWFHNASFYSCGIDDISVFETGSSSETCDAPTNVTTSNVTANSAVVSWTAGGTETAWTVEYKTASASEWTSVQTTATTATLSNLTANTAYQVRVKANCSDDLASDWSATATFTTPEESSVECVMPTNVQVSNIENHQAVVTWTAGGTETAWTVQYKRTAESTWTTANATSTSYTLTNLDGLTQYQVQVQAVCDDNNSSNFTTPVNFTTTNVNINEYMLQNAVQLFPNPATQYVDVQVNDNILVTELQVFDVYGKLISTTNVISNPARIDVSNLSNGMYYVRVISETGMITKPFVKK